MRYFNLSAVAKRLRAAVQSQRLRLAVESSRLRLKNIVVGIFIFIKDLIDSLGITDTAAKTVGKGVSDQTSTSDDSILEPGKNLIDSISASESLKFDSAKSLSDQVYATDDLGGEASIDDDQTIQFIKVRSDTTFVSESLDRTAAYQRQFADSSISSDFTLLSVSVVIDDAIQAIETTVKLLEKRESDTLLGADSGTLLNQDYVDNPYYFADDYVGDKRIF